MEQITRIELASLAWKASILPLNYIRKWCPRPESNRYGKIHKILSLACLPISPLGHGGS